MPRFRLNVTKMTTYYVDADSEMDAREKLDKGEATEDDDYAEWVVESVVQANEVEEFPDE